ncbi:MAG: VanW family protein [Firmicutes bacterium]|nr:VanW family protein [Bacillota bacterium]
MRRLVALVLVVSTLGWGVPTVFRTVHRRCFGVKQGVFLENQIMEYYYEGEVRVIVEQMARQTGRVPREAGVDKDSGQIIPHRNGLYFDVDQIVQEVINSPAGTKVPLRAIEVVPFLLTEHLEVLTHILGDFSTPLLGSPDRVENIRLSLLAVNNTLLLPGEIFSFNEIVGERTKERGYRNAPIILGETVAPGVGGGICQSSTTLYNAVRQARLEVVERRIHSMAPSYIQHGLDAAVAWPYTDFKFKNSLAHPVIIKAEIAKWRVRIWILGQKEGA